RHTEVNSVDVIAPSKAWGRRMRCKEALGNLPSEPCGWKARPVAPDQRLEASLASAGVTQAAKRRQRVRKPCYGAPKDLSREPLLFTSQGPRCGTVPVWCPQSCRRRLNRANGNGGSPGTWDARPSPPR